MARDPVFDRQVALALRGTETEVQRLFVAEIHRQVGRVYAESRPAGHDQWIDGRADAPIESVSATGTAMFEFRYLPEVVVFALNVLFANSPVDEHEKADDVVFREGRILFVNGMAHGRVKDGMSPSDFRWILDHPKGTEFVIADEELYAGKLERGHSDQAPNGVYEITCGTVRRKFGNLAIVRFRWQRIEGAPRGTPSMVLTEI